MVKRKRIDYSKFALGKNPPIRSPKYLSYIRTFPCADCQDTEDVQAHHLTHIEPMGMGMKSSDKWCLPMCGICHGYLHQIGEKWYWQERKLDPKLYATLLWDSFNRAELKEV